MHVVAFDPFVGSERYRELGVDAARTPDDLYAVADFITLHLPNTPDTRGSARRRGAGQTQARRPHPQRRSGSARGRAGSGAALASGQVAVAALDEVLGQNPAIDHPLFAYPNVIVTPHLGASTAEATDRADHQAAEQLRSALQGGVVTSAVNIPAIAPEDMDVLGPFVPLCRSLGRIASALAEGSTIDRIETEFLDGSPTGIRGCCRSRRSSACSPADRGRRQRGERPGDGARARNRRRRDQARRRRYDPDSVRVTLASGGQRLRVAGTLIGRVTAS